MPLLRARPDIILFGEYLHAYPMTQARAIAAQTDLMLIVGTSGLVAPASKLPLLAQDGNATLIEINPTPSRITPNVDVYIPGKSGYILSQMLQMLSASSRHTKPISKSGSSVIYPPNIL